MPFFPEGPPAPPVGQVADFGEFLDEYRRSLPIIGQCVYLNHASVGPLSDWIVEAVNQQLAQHQMAESRTQDAWFDGWRLARQRIGELIGASKDEICIQPNTWSALARAFSALPLVEGDEAIFPADEFPSLYHALSELRQRGCDVLAVEASTADGIVRTEDLLAAITPRTRLLATSWVNFIHGYRHDLETLGATCREREIYFAIDAIQGLGMLPLDVKRCGAHFVACNGAKWLCAPLGSGFLYVAGDVPPEVTPRLEGWFAMELNHLCYTDRTINPKQNANRFGGGTVPLPSAFGLRRACEVFLAAGPERVAERAVAFADRIEKAARRAGIGVHSDRSERKTAIVSLQLERCPALPELLKQANVAFSEREGLLRLSPHWYLLDDEVAVALEVIRSAAPAT